MNKYVFVGGGLPSMMAAYRLKKKDPLNEVIILEKNTNLGGQYSSFVYDNGLVFDHGMHLYYDTCLTQIDSIPFDVLPESEWNIYSKNEKDIAGIFFNGRLQDDTPYPDLRTSDAEFLKELISDLFQQKRDTTKSTTALDSYTDKFGKKITEKVFRPIFEKLFQIPFENLDERASGFLALNRIALMNESEWEKHSQDPWFRDRVAYPNQFTLPDIRTNNQRALYPKKFGMIHFAKKFHDLLSKSNVKCITGANVESISPEEGTITFNGGEKINGIKKVIWGAGLFTLPKYFENLRLPELKNFKKKPPTYYVNIYLKNPPKMGRLYYFYCFQPGFRTFRVTNYYNYCPQSKSDSFGYPVSVEIHPEFKDSELSRENIYEIAISELENMGIIESNAEVTFHRVESASEGFFIPAKENYQLIESLRTKASQIQNLELIGLMSSQNVFFLKDVLIDTFQKVEKL